MNDTPESGSVILDTSQFPALNLRMASPPQKQPVTARYAPKPDITAWEIAQILPGLFGKPLYEADWVALGSATRHFERLDQPNEPTVTA